MSGGYRTALLALAALLAATRGGALEPRFDHRDQLGVLLEAAASRDTATVGEGSQSLYRVLTLRLALSTDVTGDGDELVVGGSWSGWKQAAARVEWAADARYRGYFGSDELKTFFEAGLWVPLTPRLAAGPRVGLGAAWDFTRRFGVFLGFSFATAFGEFRGVSLELGSGVQTRWP